MVDFVVINDIVIIILLLTIQRVIKGLKQIFKKIMHCNALRCVNGRSSMEEGIKDIRSEYKDGVCKEILDRCCIISNLSLY